MKFGLTSAVSFTIFASLANALPTEQQHVLSSKSQNFMNLLTDESSKFLNHELLEDARIAWEAMENPSFMNPGIAEKIEKLTAKYSPSSLMSPISLFPKPSKKKTVDKESTTNDDDKVYQQLVQSEKYPDYKLRVNNDLKHDPKSLGVDTVEQSTGYFDIDADKSKHLFYWFFESRNDPANDPVIAWLNGGPGCSSLTGLFFELGPSSIDEKLEIVYNPYSWNSNASVIFLEQPVGVGYSYSDDDSGSVSSTKVAAQDVYVFLELFFLKFPHLIKNDFHIAGESYAGHYIPNIAKEIISHADKIFELTSVMIGNGITDPLIQYKYYGPMACGKGGVPQVISDEECDDLDKMYTRCSRLIETCYKFQNAISCVPANVYCERMMTPFEKTGLNYYDMRAPCLGGSDLCYEDLEYVDKYLNLPNVLETLGAEVESYTSCDDDVFRRFILTGDEPKPFQQFITDLLEVNIPVLIYAGDKDYICNWLGNLAWTEALEWSGMYTYNSANFENWTSNISGDLAGEVKSNGQFTFLRIYEAGHMVPYNQPENSLDMVNRWLSGDYSFSS